MRRRVSDPPRAEMSPHDTFGRSDLCRHNSVELTAYTNDCVANTDH